MALFAAAGICGWWLVSRVLSLRFKVKSAITFAVPIVLIAVIGIILVAQTPSGLIAIGNLLPGEASAGSRAEIFWNTWQLIWDFPFTGGGLNSFSGLYSKYMLGIPYIKFEYSHNVFLDIALEQGLLGLGAFFAILILSIRKITQDKSPNLAGIAVLMGILTIMIHGLFDDSFYGLRGSPLLLALPGIAITHGTAKQELTKTQPSNQTRRFVLAGAAIVIITAILAFGRSIVAQGYANLGAVKMSQIQLSNWPDEVISGEKFLAKAGSAEDLFKRAVLKFPQTTAHYRLGLINIERRDFERANAHLETAYRRNPNHRGIIKSLGYSYAWLGEIEAAGQTLTAIPEATYELGIYAQWWASENRTDLSEYATQTVIWLEQK
jgi:hypothetical protein